MDEHIFRWFNDRYPDLMAECLANYPDDDPAYEANQEPRPLGWVAAKPFPDTERYRKD